MILITMTGLSGAVAEEIQSVADTPKVNVQESATATNQPAGEMPRLVPWLDYTGGLWHSAGLTGDWAGTRQQLMDKVIRFDMSLIQTLQGNWTGGTDFDYPYQGNVRYGIQLDTGKAGLWPGGLFVARGETRYGNSNNLNTGALMPVNTVSLFPVPEKDVTALTDLYYMQFLAPWVGIMAGKMSMRETNVFASNETEQFMNTAFIFNPALATTVPIDALAGSVILRPTKWLTVPTMVFDSEGTADHSGFDTVFNRGTTVFQQAIIEIKPFGLAGHQRVGWTWSDKSRIQFEQNPWEIISAIITGSTAGLERKGHDWSFIYDFDQYVYTVPGKQNQGFGLFGRFGLTDGEVNPVQEFYSIGLSGKGLIPGRDNDSFGVGYYFLSISDKLPRIIEQRTQDEQGVELYYNIAITPWLHITPDLQVIEPVSKNVNTTVVAGVRMKIDF
ncbi:MAG TPA: carbohydrate porin [Candidatus Brocadiaceae bacterium]